MGNQNKRILIIQKVPLQPCDMLLVQIVGRLVQKKDIRFFQKEFCQKNLRSLTAAQICYVTFQSQIQKSQRSCNLFHLGVDHIKVMKGQLILNISQFLHQCIHFLRIRTSQHIADFVHTLLLLKKGIKSRFQHVTDGHAFFQDRMLIQIACPDIFCPFHLALIRHQLPCHNIHKSGFSFSIGSDQTNVLSFQKTEGHVSKNSTVAKSV